MVASSQHSTQNGGCVDVSDRGEVRARSAMDTVSPVASPCGKIPTSRSLFTVGPEPELTPAATSGSGRWGEQEVVTSKDLATVREQIVSSLRADMRRLFCDELGMDVNLGLGMGRGVDSSRSRNKASRVQHLHQQSLQSDEIDDDDDSDQA